jgi:hypothetical protein
MLKPIKFKVMQSFTFRTTHDRIRNGIFPVEELLKLGVNITQIESSMVKTVYEISGKIEDYESILEVVFILGALVQSFIDTDKFSK